MGTGPAPRRGVVGFTSFQQKPSSTCRSRQGIFGTRMWVENPQECQSHGPPPKREQCLTGENMLWKIYLILVWKQRRAAHRALCRRTHAALRISVQSKALETRCHPPPPSRPWRLSKHPRSRSGLSAGKRPPQPSPSPRDPSGVLSPSQQPGGRSGSRPLPPAEGMAPRLPERDWATKGCRGQAQPLSGSFTACQECRFLLSRSQH